MKATLFLHPCKQLNPLLLTKPRLRLEGLRTEPISQPATFSLSLKIFPAQGQAQPNTCPSQAKPSAAQQEVLGVNSQVSQRTCQLQAPGGVSKFLQPPGTAGCVGAEQPPACQNTPKPSTQSRNLCSIFLSILVYMITFWGTGCQLCGVVSLLKPGVR